MLYTIADIETTGLSTTSHDIIQFAYINVNQNMSIHSSGVLYFYKDNMSWTEDAEAVHGISRNQLVQYKDDFDTNLRKMYVILQKSNLVGHNVSQFDYPFCKSYLDRNGMPTITPLSLNDTMKLYMNKFKKRMKLTVLLEQLNINPDIVTSFTNNLFGTIRSSHDARWDVVATMFLFARAKREGLVADV
jgi:DNA polymerase III alpha subunit (gram-positive type)